MWDNGIDENSEYTLKVQDYRTVQIIDLLGSIFWGTTT